MRRRDYSKLVFVVLASLIGSSGFQVNAISSDEGIPSPTIVDPTYFAIEMLTNTCREFDFENISVVSHADKMAAKKTYYTCLKNGRTYMKKNLVDPHLDQRYVEFNRWLVRCGDRNFDCINYVLEAILAEPIPDERKIALGACAKRSTYARASCIYLSMREWADPNILLVAELCREISDDAEEYNCLLKTLELEFEPATETAPPFDG